VDVSLFDSLTEWLLYPMYYTAHGGVAPRRMGASHATIAPYGPFTVGDGSQVLLAVQNEREWVRFCVDVVRMPDLAQDPRFLSQELRVGNREALDAIIAERLAGLDRDTVLKRLDTADIASGRLNPIERLPEHEQLTGRWTRTGTEAGPVSTVLPPWAPPGRDGYGDVPGLGQHTAAVRDWLGLDADGTPGPDTAGPDGKD
jgi:formyl-CoA transferase